LLLFNYYFYNSWFNLFLNSLNYNNLFYDNWNFIFNYDEVNNVFFLEKG